MFVYRQNFEIMLKINLARKSNLEVEALGNFFRGKGEPEITRSLMDDAYMYRYVFRIKLSREEIS